MKKFAAGLLTVLCATAFSAAQQPYQPTDPANDWATAPTDVQPIYEEIQQPADNAQPAAVAQPAPSAPQTTAAPSAPQATAAPSATDNAQAQNNDPAPIDEQPVIVQKKTPVGIGIRGDFIYGKLWGFKDLSDGFEEPTGFGGTFGIAARFGMVEGLQFSPEIAFRIFNVSHEDDGIERCYNQMFLDISFYLRGVFGDFFLEVGPQLAINTSSEYKIDGEINEFENIEQATAEFGLNFGIGYNVIKNLSIGFRWYMGFNEVFPDVKYEGDLTDKDYNGNKKKSSLKWSVVNLKGAQTMMYKFGVTYWFM